MVTCLLVVLAAGCAEPVTYTPTQTDKWVRQCGGRLIADAATFWRELDPSLDQAAVQRQVENFLAVEGRLLTMQVIEDQGGRPVGLGLRPSFWDHTLVAPQRRATLQADTLALIHRVSCALGLVPADEWTAADTSMLHDWFGPAFGELQLAAHHAPCTGAWRRVLTTWVDREALAWPPPSLP